MLAFQYYNQTEHESNVTQPLTVFTRNYQVQHCDRKIYRCEQKAAKDSKLPKIVK